MKAKELRIGNWIQEKSTKIIHQANIYSISYCLESSDQKDRYIGIPITEEWLIKFGFISIDDDGLWESENEELFRIGAMVVIIIFMSLILGAIWGLSSESK